MSGAEAELSHVSVMKMMSGEREVMVSQSCDMKGKNWDKLLPVTVFAICCQTQASLGFYSFELLFGKKHTHY